MPLPLKEEQAVSDIAGILYDFLPGSGSSAWKGHVNFGTVAEEAGVGRFWAGGSKLPAITALLRQTLARERGCFERLILTIVRDGMTYRQKQRKPIAPDEIERLNGALLGVGFKFPDLWDPHFGRVAHGRGGSGSGEGRPGDQRGAVTFDSAQLENGKIG